MNAARSPSLAKYDRYGLLIVALASVVILACAMCGCEKVPIFQDQQAISAAVSSITTHATSAGTHADNAAAAVAAARQTAATIPAAAPVLPPLSTASAELDAVKSELSAVKGQVDTLTGHVQTLSTSVDALTATNKKLAGDNATLTTANKKLEARWDAAWIGGRSWFWIHVIEGALGALFVAGFIAEFFFDLPLHPLTWIISAAPYVAKLALNIGKGIVGAVVSLFTWITSFFKSKTIPVTPPK